MLAITTTATTTMIVVKTVPASAERSAPPLAPLSPHTHWLTPNAQFPALTLSAPPHCDIQHPDGYGEAVADAGSWTFVGAFEVDTEGCGGKVSEYDRDSESDDENDREGVTDDVNEREGVTELVSDRVAVRVDENEREGLAGATQQLHVSTTAPAQPSTQMFEAPHCGAQQLVCSDRAVADTKMATAMSAATM